MDQERYGLKFSIDERPTTIILYRTSLIDNGLGEMVPDPFGTPAEVTYRVRISNERTAPPGNTNVPSGLSSAMGKMITSDWNSPIYEGETFEDDDVTWRIGAVRVLKCKAGILGYQAPLLEAGS